MRRTRHTRRRTRHKRKHRRRRTRRHHKRRRTRHRRRRRGGVNVGNQVIQGGYKEGLLIMKRGGGKKPSWAISDYPPGFSKFLTKDKKQWKKIKKHRKH